MMKQICQTRYMQELTENEYHLLKQKNTFFNSTVQLFDHTCMAQSLLTCSIEDPQIKQDYYEQFKSVAESYRANLFTLHMECAEQERNRCKKMHDDNMKKYVSSFQYSLDDNKKLSPDMARLIHERCAKISERIICIFKHKKYFFL